MDLEADALPEGLRGSLGRDSNPDRFINLNYNMNKMYVRTVICEVLIKWPKHQAEIIKRGNSCLFVGCLTPQQHASVSQGRICSDNCTCCHTEIEVADQTFHLTQSQYTDIGPTSPRADPITPGAWQGSHWSANF